MVQPASSHPHQSTLRQLKWLVALLILSNIGLGVFGFYVLRSIDRRYSDLIGQSVPLLNDLQTLTARSVEAMRGTGPNLLELPAAGRAEFARHSRQTLLEEQSFRQQILGDYRIASAAPTRLEVHKSGEAFTTTAIRVLDSVGTGQTDEAKKLRDAELRPAFEHYLDAITKAADEVEAASLRANQDFTAKTGSLSNVILGVASWPVIVFVALLAITAVFVLGLMVLFRGREMGDAP
jgi:hypothetical protein